MLSRQHFVSKLTNMKIARITKTPSQHITAILCNEDDPFDLAIGRSPDGALQFLVEDYTHKFIVSLNKNEEAELLSKLKLVCN